MYTVLCSLALRMTAVTSIILIIKRLAGTKISALWHNFLWLIPLTQFVFCIFDIKIKSSAGIYNHAYYETPDYNFISLSDVFESIWIWGIIIWALWYISVLISTYIRIKKLPENKYAFSDELKMLGIRRKPIIKKSESPACFGRYVIIPEKCNKMVAIHEFIHYAGYDCLKMRLAAIILGINWFNPILWIAYKRFISDLEMLCDERTVKYTGNKKEYAKMLIDESTGKIFFTPGVAFTGSGKKELSARIKGIASAGKKKTVWTVCTGIICLIVCITFLTEKPVVITEPVIRENTEYTPAVIANTPEPVPEATPVPENTITSPAPVKNNKTVQKNSLKHKEQNSTTGKPSLPEDKPEQVENRSYAPAVTATPVTKKIPVTDMEIGSTKDEIYEKAGRPQNSSSNGSRETYILDDGNQAVLQYNGEVLENAYILEN